MHHLLPLLTALAGLTDVQSNSPLGKVAEETVEKYQVPKADQVSLATGNRIQH